LKNELELYKAKCEFLQQFIDKTSAVQASMMIPMINPYQQHYPMNHIPPFNFQSYPHQQQVKIFNESANFVYENGSK
jgi:hypothetical protein